MLENVQLCGGMIGKERRGAAASQVKGGRVGGKAGRPALFSEQNGILVQYFDIFLLQTKVLA